ncbi:MAG: hypothetical protein ACRETD_11760, partial [Steroidobacteraceae bacterium]
MIRISLRAAATAFILGIATVAAATMAMTVTAEAAVRPAVGRPLKNAVALAASGNYKAALAAVNAAASVGGLTGDERAAIAQVRNYISAKSGNGGGKGGIATDYLAGKYSAVIAAGRRGGLDAQSMQLVAQAYYLTHDYRDCASYIQTHFGGGASEPLLELQMRCAYEVQDNDAMRGALEQLVARTNKPEYWTQLLSTAEGTKGLSDHQTLDIYRLKLMTGTLVKADDYMLLAQLGLQLGFAAEAQSVIQKGIDAKVLSGDRVNRLLKLAQTTAAGNAANVQGIMAHGNGDALVKLGEDAWGQGRFQDAVNLIQSGIKKGVTNSANAQIRLGLAYLG